MSWNKILGQEHVKKSLQKAIIDNRMPHAYCFLGIEGVGKEAIAIEFAKVANCESPIIKDGEINACEVCHSCRMANQLQHPNIYLIHSLPTGKGATSNDSSISKLSDEEVKLIQEEIELKATNPYHKITIPKANQIKIASIRDIKRTLSLANAGNGRIFILVFNAEEMTQEAANAFLKTLEEPKENVTIIITSSRQELLLPTIISRCQQLFFRPISQDNLEKYLIDNYHINETEARLSAAFGQGSITKSIHFLDEDMKNLREDIVDIFRISLKKRVYRLEMFEKLEDIIAEKDKKKIEAIIILLIIWLRDAYTIIKTDDIRNVINTDQIKTLKNFAKNFANADIEAAITTVEESIYHLKRNVAPQLLIIDMFLRLREILLK